ncbi:MAG: tyrosine recombinase [Ardenticatenaceae bacterium]|nr:tyrosine recombinase [Ardenticatenaceae bacterium]
MYDRVDTFLEYLRYEENYSENTIGAYRNDLSQFLSFIETTGLDRWDAIKRETIVNFLFHLRDREYASSTVARKMAAVKSFFHHLVQAGEIHDDPTATVDSPKVKKYAPKALTMEEVINLLAEPAKDCSVKGMRDRAMMELLYATGLRVSELVGLQVGDMNLASATLRCRGPRHSERILPIAPRALEALRVYLDRGRIQLLRDSNEQTLFLNMRGGRLTRQGLWLIIRYYVEQAGITAQVTPHTLRHSFAMHQLREGAELSEVQELLGHANISTTQVYAQAQQDRASERERR